MWYILISLVALFSTAASSVGGQVNPEQRLIELKKDTRVFEKIVTEVLRQRFENPFALAAEPHGAFLPGYGVVLSFHLKVSRGTIRGFERVIPDPAGVASRSKDQQVEVVRETMLRALADYGSTVKNLLGTERLALCAQVEDRNELDPSKSRTVLVLGSTKADIDLFTTRQITDEEFQKRVQQLEY